MNSSRSSRLVLYETPSFGKFQKEKSNQQDPNSQKTQAEQHLRQQLTLYLQKFRQQSVGSNLLIQNQQQGLPTLYAKAKKYSVFTTKRKPHRSFDLRQKSQRIGLQVLPTLRRGRQC